MTAAPFERVTIITPPTDCDVGGVWEVIEEYALPGGDSHIRLRQGNSYFGTQRSNVRTAADKPRADLVALFDAFARLPPGNATLSLFGDEHNAALCAWAARHGHRVNREPMFTPLSGRWTMLSVRVTGGTIAIHLDSVQEQPAAEGSV